MNSRENFMAECETMDLSPIKNETFLVAVSTGDRNKVKFLCSTIHGPYSFVEMMQEVGDMWKNHQHHAKVIVLEKDATKAVKILDEATIDYIECYYLDLIAEEMLVCPSNKKYTCAAETISDNTVAVPEAEINAL